MPKIFKYSIIIIFAVVYSIVQLFNPKILPGFETLWSILTVIVALALYFYNDSLWVFSFVNNIWNNLWRKPQVTWEMSFVFQTTDQNIFNNASQKLTRHFNELSSIEIIHNTENYLEFQIEKPDIRKYTLSLNEIDDDIFEICCSYKCTLSFKKSKKELTISKDFFSKIFNSFSKIEYSEDDSFPLASNNSYTLILSFSDSNPVYGLMARRINPDDIKSFSIDIMQEKASIKIQKNYMKIVTNDINQLEEISKNYLALADTI
ncbi:hypothetical protein CUN31_03345 [Enterococcus faecalis]|uniref:hypothetical protein n=1 Tax=Enterococcus faecalis TaxID=1351 RepID=UPI0002EB662C|nr:hypothetical protein [Enterococcus faecalis]EHZ2968478.1 hypothetical protein [Enterococcus faecalis]EIB6795285.1 hypothetical protein [Enterococcus faecalis]PQB33923.1 hypothetical protein CUN31_03345 [Enterococcus faecalis]PQB45741.1 hypothetical protein CUM81_08085 [Enterococcus faecalis]